MTEPPLQIVFQGRFHAGVDLPVEPPRRAYQYAAKQIAFRAMTTGKLAARLVHVSRIPEDALQCHFAGGWLIADPSGAVTAHRGQSTGGGPWQLADAVVPGSSGAVKSPTLSGFYRDRPDAFGDLVARYESSMRSLAGRHSEAAEAGHVYATMTTHVDPGFLPLLSAAIADRTTQLILHDWLAERDFPHVDELRSKRWNQGKWTENQLLDLLSKPFTTTRRSFLGRTVQAPI